MIKAPKNSLPLIKEALYRHPGISRTELSELLGIKIPSIVPYISHLIEDGIIEEVKDRESRSKKSAGRYRVKLELKKKVRYVIGIELGPYATYLSLFDTSGMEVIKHRYESAPEEYKRTLELCNRIIEVAIEELNEKKDKILGVSIGVPGYVDKEKNELVIVPYRKNWEGKPLIDELSKMTGLKVTIENNSRARSIYAELFLSKSDISYFAYLLISRGMACPIIVNGEDISRSTRGAGEIGYSVVDYTGGVNLSSCGRLINEASETAILAKCRALMEEGKSTSLSEEVGKSGDLKLSHILSVLDKGDEEVTAIIDRAMMYLGYTIGNLINVINPEIFYIDAYITKSEKVREILTGYIMKSLGRLSTEEISLDYLDFDEYRGSYGSAADAIREFFINA